MVPSRLSSLVRRVGWRPWHYAVLILAHVHLIESGAKAGAQDWQFVFYPWADALRFSILRYGQFPWWNPWSIGGQPLFADPQIAVLTPDTLFLLVFGTVVGFKLLILFYVAVGYEGSRRLCRHLFGDDPFVRGVSIIPALIPALALHFNEGHVVFLVFYLFPWLLLLGLTWQRSAARSVAFGAIIGFHLLSYVHYTVIMSFSIVGLVVLVGLVRSARSIEYWTKAALVASTALGIALTRIGLTLIMLRRFPRVDSEHYPIAASISEVVRTLVEPLQDRRTQMDISGLGWWELGSYVGFLVLVLAYEGLRRGPRKLWLIHGAAVLCLLFAWNNRDKVLPGYWMHFIPPWANMIVITRWRLFASFFLLLGAVEGLVAVRRNGRAVVAVGLAAGVVLDLGFHTFYSYRGTFVADAPPIVRGTDPPESVFNAGSQTWSDVRMNHVALESECSLLGWGFRPSKHQRAGTPSYSGDFVGTKPLSVEEWTPNRIVLQASPGDVVTLNINPSNYWVMNGERLFPTYRQIEPDLPFRVTAPAGGRIELIARPQHLSILLIAQGLFALAAAVLYRWLTRRAKAQGRR